MAARTVSNIEDIVGRFAQEAAKLVYSESDLDALGVASRHTRWRWRRAHIFPEPVRAGGRTFYLSQDILSWLEDPESWAQNNK